MGGLPLDVHMGEPVHAHGAPQPLILSPTQVRYGAGFA